MYNYSCIQILYFNTQIPKRFYFLSFPLGHSYMQGSWSVKQVLFLRFFHCVCSVTSSIKWELTGGAGIYILAFLYFASWTLVSRIFPVLPKCRVILAAVLRKMKVAWYVHDLSARKRNNSTSSSLTPIKRTSLVLTNAHVLLQYMALEWYAEFNIFCVICLINWHLISDQIPIFGNFGLKIAVGYSVVEM